MTEAIGGLTNIHQHKGTGGAKTSHVVTDRSLEIGGRKIIKFHRVENKVEQFRGAIRGACAIRGGSKSRGREPIGGDGPDHLEEEHLDNRRPTRE